MQTGYFNLFLGLLFQFNITFRGIDILPDIVGYYFIYKSLPFLIDKSIYFKTANKIIIPLGILSIVNIYNFQYHPDIILSYSMILDGLKTFVFAANMYLIYNLCKGSSEVVATLDSYLQKNIMQRLYLYLGIAGLLLLLSIISLFSFSAVNTSLQSVFTITYFAYIFILVLIISAFYNLYRRFSASPAKASKKKKQKATNIKARQTKNKR